MKNKLVGLKENFALILFIILCLGFYIAEKEIYKIIYLIILILLGFIVYYKKNKVVKKDKRLVANFLNQINENVNRNLLNLVYPVLIIEEDGEIVWNNNKFLEFNNDSPIGKNILSIIRELDLSRLLLCDSELYQRISLGNETFKVYASKISLEEFGEKYIVYLNDITNIEEIEGTTESILLLEVDNFQEALENTEESDRPLLVAEIEREVNLYAQRLKGMIVKYENNKYILSVKNRFIESEIENKFEILSSISKIDKGNKLEVTLSIGIGTGGLTPQENYGFALTAKELALGRGGDQVAIKNQEKIIFFGGNKIEREKRTRVRARVIANALKDIVYDSSHVFIIGHKNPDMDCFGASIGIASIVNQIGKKCSIVLNNDTNGIEYYLNKLKEIDKYKDMFITSNEVMKRINDKSLLVIVDVHNTGYVQDMNIVNKINRKIIIDHHRRSPDIITGTLLSYIEVYASSTSELVTEIIQYMVKKSNLTPIEAEGLLAGIFMDTKGFSFKTGVRTFDAAAFLRKQGADALKVRNMFTDTLEDYLAIADIIRSADVNDNLAIATAHNKINNQIIIARAADELLNISGIEVCFVVGSINNDIIISGRSSSDINVQIILEELGGGGHMNMAGAKLENMKIEEAIKLLKESISKNLRVGE